MGTNFYAVKRKPTIEEPIHIGKSSGGWLFLFREQNESWKGVEWHTYEQVKEWLQKNVVETKEYVILDEYDNEFTYEFLIKLIDDKQKDKYYLANPDNFTYCKNVNGYRFSDREFS